MPAESLPQLDVLLMDVLTRPRGERAAFMDAACGPDRKLRGELEALLKLHEQAGSFLESPAVALPARRDLSDLGEQLGSVIGRYKLLEHIGEGGFGSVFMAEQEKPVRRKVALKIIKLGMDTRSVIARFEAERQALAMMDHPHIARVFDAGATETGRPYFVMELVKGTPITAFCDEQCLTVRQRLELFIQVCQAVQHAHTKGVIHRDLKPSNILAVSNDGTPTIKVIDFGIAKATGDRLTDKTLFTEFRQLIGTPAYMSPEQAGQSDIDVDTRSDIYSLGVLLYELLTGTTPFDAKSLEASGYDEMRRVIREVEPPSPSRRLSSLSELRTHASNSSSIAKQPIADTRDSVPGRSDSSSITLANVAAQRHSEPMALVRQLNGDLDWIVMTCLEKDRSRRYETASALAADMQRHLAGDPVVAAPPSRFYRASKTLRRHRTAAAVAVGFVVLIVASFLSLGALWRNAVQARDAESDQRARSAAVSAFLAEMLTAADPAKTKGAKLTVSDALDTAAKRVEEGAFQGQPLVEAEIRYTIGSTYFGLGLYSKAKAQLQAANTIQTRELGPEHLDTLRTRCKLVETLNWTCDYSESIAIAEPTLAAQQRILGPDHADTLQTMANLGQVLTWARYDRFTEGETLLRTVLEHRERLLGKEHVDTAKAMGYLGDAYTTISYPEKAEPFEVEAVRIHRKLLGDEHPDTLQSLYLLAGSVVNQGRSYEAEVMLRQILEVRRRVLGPEHPGTQGAVTMLGMALQGQGRYAEAESFYREGLDLVKRTVGTRHADWIAGHRFLASCLGKQKRYREAEQLLRDVLPIAREQFGHDAADTTIRTMYLLAWMLGAQHKDAEAEQLAREVIELQRRQQPPPSPDERRDATIVLIDVLNRRGALAEAMAVERELIDAYLAAANVSGASEERLIDAANRLTITRFVENRDAPRAIELALRANEQSGFKNPASLHKLAQAYHRNGDSSRAREVWKQAFELVPNDEARASRLISAAEDLLRATPESLRDPVTAIEYARRANTLIHNKNADYLDTLARAFQQAGDRPNAIETAQTALSVLAADAPNRDEFEARLREFQAASEPADVRR